MAAPESAGCRIGVQLAEVEEDGGSEVRKAVLLIRVSIMRATFVTGSRRQR